MVEEALATPVELPQWEELQSLEELQVLEELQQLENARLQEDLEELVAWELPAISQDEVHETPLQASCRITSG